MKYKRMKSILIMACLLFVGIALKACGMAKSMGAKMTVSRVDRYDYTEKHNQGVLHSMGVDKVIFL